MKSNKKVKIVGLIIVFFFPSLYFSIKFTDFPLGINNDDIWNKDITPISSATKDVLYEWNRSWGGIDYDYGQGVAVDSSGNVFCVGYTASFGAGSFDLILVKYNGMGVQQWNRTWGGVNSDYCDAVAVDSSGNVYCGGSTHSFGAGSTDILLVKYDGNGVQQWNRTWGGVDDDRSYGVAVDSSGNVYCAGVTSSFGAESSDIVVIKYDGNGVKQWNRTWGGADADYGNGVAVDSLGNVYCGGFTSSFGAGSDDIVVVKYNGMGVQQWNRTWGGADADYDQGVTVDSLGNVYLAGNTYSFGAGSSDIVVVKYDGNGVQQWNRTWGGVNIDSGEGLVVDSSGNVYLGGYTYSFGVGTIDMVLVNYNEDGIQQWNCTWGGGDVDGCLGIAMDSKGNVYLEGSTYSYGEGNADIALVKYKYLGGYPYNGGTIIIITTIIVVSMVSGMGVCIALILLIRKRRKA
ncbi:MAG: SBBP repeat-containing protein [Promethearchaeota archaeon]